MIKHQSLKRANVFICLQIRYSNNWGNNRIISHWCLKYAFPRRISMSILHFESGVKRNPHKPFEVLPSIRVPMGLLYGLLVACCLNLRCTVQITNLTAACSICSLDRYLQLKPFEVASIIPLFIPTINRFLFNFVIQTCYYGLIKFILGFFFFAPQTPFTVFIGIFSNSHLKI